MALVKWLSPVTFGNPVIEEWINSTAFEALGRLFGPIIKDRQEVRKLIIDQHKFLMKKLAKYFRDKCCAQLSEDKIQVFESYKKFFVKIRKHFDVGVYNLNYDNIALNALREGFGEVLTGFNDKGHFTPKEIIFGNNGWGYLYHLHGSVHFNHINLIDTTQRKSIVWKGDLNGEFCDYDLPQLESSPENMRTPYTTLLAGGFKLEQLTPEPFQSFYASLTRNTHEADAFLIIGYGFGDSHVNRALQNRFYLHHPKLKFPKVHIVDFGQMNNYWNHFLRQAFYLSKNVRSDKIYSRPNGEKLVQLDKRGTKVALANPQKIIEWLC